MTDQELNDLDRLLAEKVMEWREYLSFGELPAWQDQEGNHCGYVNVCDYPNPWCPTRSIEQAMMVAEKIGVLSDDGFDLCFTPWHSLKKWSCNGFGVTKEDEPVKTDTPALAICLAAQAWVRGKQI